MPNGSKPLYVGFILAAIVLAVVSGVLFFTFKKTPVVPPPVSIPPVVAPTSTPALPEIPWQTMSVIGSSVAGRPIEAHTYGTGSTSLLFVGGIHGGYEWNSSLLAYEVMDYLALHPEAVPSSLTIHIIPTLNPDGVFAVIGKLGRFTLSDVPKPNERVASARFNQNNVDLNRNFACKWQATSTWQGRAVSAGTSAFSEPEAVALRDYVLTTKPQSVVMWHSKASNVYASECEQGILPTTLTLMNAYAKAAGYGAVASFDSYPVTGDAEGWLASIGIPAVTVELTTANQSEWAKNWAGMQAVFKMFSPPAN